MELERRCIDFDETPEAELVIEERSNGQQVITGYAAVYNRFSLPLREGGSFPSRIEQHNRNGLAIAECLRRHPAVEKVWYPRWEFAEVYEAVMRRGGGYGGLITFLPRNAAQVSPAVYDRLEICKGPSLGTVFSLACPFTLLAHYTELDWAEDCGVSRYLIRLSVGLEDPDELWTRIERALSGPVAV